MRYARRHAWAAATTGGRFTGIGVAVTVGICLLALLACGSGTTSVTSNSPGNTSGPHEAGAIPPTDTPAGPRVATVGQTVTVSEVDGTQVAATVTRAQVVQPGQYDSIPAGQSLIKATITLKNLGSAEYSYGPYSFGAEDGNGNITEVQFLSDVAPDEMQGGTLAPGGSNTATLLVTIPTGDHAAALTWQPGVGDAKGAVRWKLGL